MYAPGVGLARPAVPAFLRLAGHPVRWRLLTELAGSDLRVRELVALTGQPQNLVSYHLRLLRDGGLVSARRSSFDGRDSYYHLSLDRCAAALASAGAAVHPALRATPGQPASGPTAPVRVLFVCTGNSSRSPMAEALLRRRGVGGIQAASAGTVPKPHLHPDTVRVLRDEYGIDFSGTPRHVNTLAGRRFDYLITICDKAREVGPEQVDHSRRIHWSVPDPADAGGPGQAAYPAFARAAADIDARIRHLVPVLTSSAPRREEP